MPWSRTDMVKQEAARSGKTFTEAYRADTADGIMLRKAAHRGAGDAGDDQRHRGGCANAVEHLLPAGHQSLGIHLDLTHVAATPVGLPVTATAEALRVEGRTI